MASTLDFYKVTKQDYVSLCLSQPLKGVPALVWLCGVPAAIQEMLRGKRDYSCGPHCLKQCDRWIP